MGEESSGMLFFLTFSLNHFVHLTKKYNWDIKLREENSFCLPEMCYILTDCLDLDDNRLFFFK